MATRNRKAYPIFPRETSVLTRRLSRGVRVLDVSHDVLTGSDGPI